MTNTLDDDQWLSKTYNDKTVNRKIPKSDIQYKPVELPDYFNNTVTETIDGTRYYLIDNNKYPSITSVIKATDKEGSAALAKWRNAIGKEAAQKITTNSAIAGTKWHSFCEKYLTHQPIDWRYFIEPEASFQANNIADALNENIESVIASETAIKSDYYGIAGRMDVAVKLKDGRYAVMDFKTGRKEKSGNRLERAMIQSAFYGLALAENTNITPTVVVVLQILKDKILWQESDIILWKPKLKQMIIDYSKIINC